MPRVLVCLPKGSAALEPQVERAFSWASLATISPDSVARRFPPSSTSREIAADERRLDELVRAAEADFLALKFDDATARLDEAGKIIDGLPPSVRHEAAYVRVQLLQGRVAQARGDARAADAFARAGEAAVDVELDEADYPPAVRKAYKAARAAARARPRRTVELASEPAGAEIEVNGQLAGRTPATLSLPPGRCFLSLTRAGFKPHLAACPSDRTSVALEPAGKDGLRDQLRDRIAADPAWFLEPLLLDTLAAEENARWIVVLDRDKGRALKALVFSAAEHALKPVEPSRLLDTELDKLSAAVRGLVLRTQRLEAQADRDAAGPPRAGGARRRSEPGQRGRVRAPQGERGFPAPRPGGARGRAVLGRAAVAARQRRRVGRRILTSRGATRAARSRAGRATPRHRCASGARRRAVAAPPARRAGTCGRRWPSSRRARPRPASIS